MKWRFSFAAPWMGGILSLALIAMATVASAQIARSGDDAWGALNSERTEAERLVRTIKSALKPGAPSLEEARLRYESARISQESYLAALLFMIRHGTSSYPEFEAIATRANRDIAEFGKYVLLNTSTTGSPGFMNIAATMHPIAIKIVQQFQQLDGNKREEQASLLEKDIRWKPWAEIQ